MKRWFRVAGMLAIVLLIFCRTPMAIAVEGESPIAVQKPAVSPYPRFNSFAEKMELLQEDKQLQELVEKDLERSITIRAQIQDEVDRAFSHTTTLLNVLLAVLTCLPVLAAASIWFIRRSVLNQIIAETKRQLQEEVGKQLEAEVTAEITHQTEAFQKKLEQLEVEFQTQLSQLKSLFSDAQKQKDQIIQELSQITPSPIRDSANPETQQKIQALTEQLERLKSSNAELSFTANDYIEQGKAFYFESRYEDAIACYDRALQTEPENSKAWFSRGAALVKLQRFDEATTAYDRAIELKSDFAEAWFGRGTVLTKQQQFEAAIAAYDRAITFKPDLFVAWFGKARCFAFQGKVEPVLENLRQAIQLNGDRAKEAVKSDSAFDPIRENQQFQSIIS